MAAANEAGGEGLTEAWFRRERVLEEFETAWRRGERPALETYLAVAETDRGALLRDLAQADLEWRLKAGEPARVEDYLGRYPELAAQPEAVWGLLAAEYGFRRGHEPGLSAAEFEKRFPQYRSELASLSLGLPEAVTAQKGDGMHPTPVSLLERLRRAPDPATWERFVKLYTPLLFFHARRLRLPDHDTADLVQDVFVKLLQTLPEFSYDKQKSFRAWLRTVVQNCYRDHRRRRTVATVEAEALASAAEADPVPELDEAEYRDYLTRRAMALIQADFEPAAWQAFWGCTALGRPAAAVAAELHKTVGAVRAANFRVLNRLRQELQGLMD